MMTQRRWLVLSGAIVAGVGILDVYEDRTHGVTLSQTIRETARVHTPVGAFAVLGSLSLLAGVLGVHFLNGAVRVVGDAIEAAADELGGAE